LTLEVAVEDISKMRHFDFHLNKLAWHRAMLHMIHSTFGVFMRPCDLTLVGFQAIQDFISSAVAWDGQAFAKVTERRQRNLAVLDATRVKFFSEVGQLLLCRHSLVRPLHSPHHRGKQALIIAV